MAGGVGRGKIFSGTPIPVQESKDRQRSSNQVAFSFKNSDGNWQEMLTKPCPRLSKIWSALVFNIQINK